MPPYTSHRASYHLDTPSGLTWTENTVKAHSRRGHAFSQSPYSPARAAGRHGRCGTPSLEELSILTLLEHIDGVAIDTLVGLPLHIGRSLWARIEQAHLTTPTVFAAFCRAFPNEPSFLYYRVAEIVQERPFPEYINLLSSPSIHWLTALTISNVDLSRLDLMGLSSLPNLVALDVYTATDAPSLVDDRLLQNWRAHVEEKEGAFKHLQVLILRNQTHVTARALEHLSAFPSLTLFGVKGCGISVRDEKKAQELGWTTQDQHGILKEVQRDIEQSRTWDGAIYGCVRRSTGILVAAAAGTGDSSLIPEEGDEEEGEDDDVEEAMESTYHTQEPQNNVKACTTPLLNFRLGHTSSDVLGLSTFSPLVFFRCLKHSLPATTPPADMEPTNAAKEIWPDQQRIEARRKKERLLTGMRSNGAVGTGGPKRRRMRASVARNKEVEQMLDAFGMDVSMSDGAVGSNPSMDGIRRDSRSH